MSLHTPASTALEAIFLLTVFPVPMLAVINKPDLAISPVTAGLSRAEGIQVAQYVTNTRGAARTAAQRQVIQPSRYSQLPDNRPQNDQVQELAHDHQQQEEEQQEDDQEQYESVLPYSIPNSKQYYGRIFQYPHQYRYYPSPNPFPYPMKYHYQRPGPILKFPPAYVIPGPGAYYPRPHYPPPIWVTGRSGVSGPASLPGRPLWKWPCDMVHSVPCHNERVCVPREAVCDGINHCGDMEDETDCTAPANCTHMEFQCANHDCVPQLWRCDGEADCIDSSDELNCTTSPCSDLEFSCGDGSCISASMHCNQIPECPDSSDEINCDEPHFPSCDGDELLCKYPLCVLNEYKCDGDNDCGDWSDEKDCENSRKGISGGVIGATSVEAVCTADQFRCTDGACIPKRARCDGHGDCDSGEDEEKCENSERYPNTCPPGQRACNAGRCIAASWFCDGEPDCSTGEDEENCPVSCNPDHEYKCLNDLQANGTTIAPVMSRNFVCIRKSQVCDAEFDCPQKDDEASCPVPYPCDASSPCVLCLKATNGSGLCGCEMGFTLASDGVTCVDVDECSEEHGPCQHECENVQGSFHCKCREGYVLRPDQRGCKRVGSVAKLIISNRVDIREVNLNTLYSAVVLPGLHNAVALDVHYSRNEIYWIDFSMHLVKRAFINGSGETDLVRWGLQEPNGLAVDWVHDIMLWTDSYWRRVQASTLDGTSIYTVVHTGLDKPRDIAVSPKHGLIFWTDWGPNPRVERAGIDGSSRRAIVTKNTDWPNGLALDADGERIYWADARYHVIETAKIDGSDRKALVVKGLPHPFALTVLEEEIYWTDWHTRSVMAADKTGKRRRTLLNRLHFPMQVHSFHNSSQRPATSRCPKPPKHCRYLCLPNERSYTCVCPIGTKLLEDGVTCERVPKMVLFYIRNKEIRIRGIPNETGKGNDAAMMTAAEEVVPVDGVRSAVSLDWDDEQDLIFWSDKKTKTINCAHRNGSDQHVILDTHLQNPVGISFDYVTRRMYFIDTLNNRIESVDMKGNFRVVIVNEKLYMPQSLVVHPPAGQMVWSGYRYTRKRGVYIEAAGMDGENRRYLKVIPSMTPIYVSLSVDPRDGRVYWSNSGTETIESMMLDGSSQSTIERPNAGTPIGLSVLAGRIFWADNSTGQIRENQSDAALKAGITSLRGVSIWHNTRHKMSNPCSPAKNNGGCAHICLLAFPPPSTTCRCRIGYTLMDDKRSCSKWPSTSLLMVKNSELRRFPLNEPYTLSETMSIPKMLNVAAADVDTETGEIYWIEADSGVIMRVPSEGGNGTQIVVKHIGRSFGLAIDAISRNIYWTDSAKRTLEVQQIDAGWRRVLIWEGLENPYSVITMPSHGYLFWSDWGQEMGKIERAQMDGYERASILSENIGWPNALAVDVKEERIYWTDLKTNTLESAKIDGGSRKIILKDRPEPYGIALYGDVIYWSDAKTMALHMVNRKGGGETTVMTGLQAVLSLKVLTHPNDTKTQTKIDTSLSCKNSKCSHLCLPVPKKGYTCACPTGLPLLPGGTNCSVLPEAELFFALGRGPAMGRMALPPVRFHDTPMTPQGVHHTTALDFHWQKKLVIFVSSHYRMLSHTKQQTTTIMAISLENVSNPYPVVHVTEGYVEGIAVDWVADNIFWTDVSRSVIEVARLDGTSRRTIIRSSYNSSSLRSLAVFPRRGWIFWSDWLADGNPVARIERAGLDGSNRKTIVETDLERPNGLTIDYKAYRLYWADSGRGRIESSNFSGSDRMQLVPEAPHLFGLTMHGDYVYWTNYELHTLQRANKFTGRNHLAVDTAMMDIRDVKVVSESRQPPGGACAVDNGGCSHLCLAHPQGYVCACPDDPVKGCVQKEMPYEDNNTDYPEQSGPIPELFDSGHKDPSFPVAGSVPVAQLTDFVIAQNSEISQLRKRNGTGKLECDPALQPAWFKRIVTTYFLLLLMVASIIVLLVSAFCAAYIYWRRNMKSSSAKYQPSEPVVITFSNPNYYSEGPSTGSGSAADGNPGNLACVPDTDVDVEAADDAPDRYPNLWRRLKYDKTMECVTIGLGNAEATALISTASSPITSATSFMAATDSSVIT